jgi:hypothetical protein
VRGGGGVWRWWRMAVVLVWGCGGKEERLALRRVSAGQASAAELRGRRGSGGGRADSMGVNGERGNDPKKWSELNKVKACQHLTPPLPPPWILPFVAVRSSAVSK